jgi:hypothetical protein
MTGIVGHHGLMLQPAGGANPTAVAIYNALVAWWDFEDNSAATTFNDSHGSNHLTIRSTSGTVASSTAGAAGGMIGRRFNNNVTYCGVIPRSNTNLDLPNTDHTYGGWMQMPASASGSSKFVMGRLGASGTTIQSAIFISGTNDRVQLQATSDGSTAVVADSGTSSGGNSVWNFVTATLNRASNLIEIRRRAVGAGSLTKVTTAFPSALYTTSSTANFVIGNAVSSDSTFFSGSRMGLNSADSCLYMTKAISDAEFDYLYNGGVGMNYTTFKTAAGH